MFITNKDVSLSTVKPYAGQNVKITAKVRNKGAAANSSLVSFYQGDPQNEGQLIATKKLDALSYLGSQEIECSWPTGSIPQQQEIHVVVDPLNKIEEGKYQVKYKSVDKVGNQEQENNLTVIIDETAPETTVKATADKWSDGWFKIAPRVTLSAQDNLEGSGVDEIYYRYVKREKFISIANHLLSTRKA
ncbi:MAG: CARDB domain-containing protein [Bacillota bacterium]